jgi:hypothetical protein
MRARQAVLLTPSKYSRPTQLFSCKQKAPATHLESTLVEVFILTDLNFFRINTYEKHRGEGVLLLTRNPKKDFYPEGAPRLKDLSSFPTRESVLRSTATGDDRRLRPCRKGSVQKSREGSLSCLPAMNESGCYFRSLLSTFNFRLSTSAPNPSICLPPQEC